LCYEPATLRANSLVIRATLIGVGLLFGASYISFGANNIYKKLALTIIAMVGFAFVSVPMYNALCTVTGLNGKSDNSKHRAQLLLNQISGGSTATDATTANAGIVTVEFVVNHNQQMAWTFKPQHTFMQVRRGELASTGYIAKNVTNKTMIAQAIPSIAPARAAKYFKKVECFCFNSQKLGPNEIANFGLRFYLDPNLPRDIKRITLSYTLFDITSYKE
jgi:cytochrome c oxidase assembly protein subunit 11